MRSTVSGRVMVGALTQGPLADRVLDLAAMGRAGLSGLLGDSARRHTLFRRGMRADRFLVATVEGELAGYLSLKYDGIGPFAPTLADFIHCYGWTRGAYTWAAFSALEARVRARRGGAYGYGLDVLVRFRGIKRHPPNGVGGELLAAAIEHVGALGFQFLDMEVRTVPITALIRHMGAIPVEQPRFSVARLLQATAGDYRRYCIKVPPRSLVSQVLLMGSQ